MTSDLFTRAESAAAFVLSQTALRPQIGLVLGSGLGSFADGLAAAVDACTKVLETHYPAE